MFQFGLPIQAPEDLFENLPEGVTPLIASRAYALGHVSGSEGVTHHMFMETPELQHLYDRGHAQGEKESRFHKALDEAAVLSGLAGLAQKGPEGPEKAPAEAPRLRDRAGKALSKAREAADPLEVTNCCLAAIVGIELLRLRGRR